VPCCVQMTLQAAAAGALVEQQRRLNNYILVYITNEKGATWALDTWDLEACRGLSRPVEANPEGRGLLRFHWSHCLPSRPEDASIPSRGAVNARGAGA
jgi:hypothetical protein